MANVYLPTNQPTVVQLSYRTDRREGTSARGSAPPSPIGVSVCEAAEKPPEENPVAPQCDAGWVREQRARRKDGWMLLGERWRWWRRGGRRRRRDCPNNEVVETGQQREQCQSYGRWVVGRVVGRSEKKEKHKNEPPFGRARKFAREADCA